LISFDLESISFSLLNSLFFIFTKKRLQLDIRNEGMLSIHELYY
jgi:hypothetical protein